MPVYLRYQTDRVLKSVLYVVLGVAAHVLLVPNAYADSVPSHLAGMAANLYRASEAEFDSADPDDTHGWATIQAKKALRDNGVHRWRKTDPPKWTGKQDVVDHLDLGSEDENQNKILHGFLKQAWSDGTRAATLKLYADLNRPEPEPEALTSLVADLDKALSAGYDDLVRDHLIKGDEGPDISLQWQPEQGTFHINIKEEGSEFQAPYQTSLEGQVEPDLAQDDDDAPVSFDLKPAPVPIKTLDSQDLTNMRTSIFGEWTDQAGGQWVIAPMDGTVDTDPEEKPKINRRAELLGKLAKAQDELDGLRGSKVYVWVIAESGEREEQERFRRKKDPWEYKGEEAKGAGSDERIAELEQEISSTNDELSNGPKVQPAPELAEPTEDKRVQSIRVSYTRSDGSVATMDQARLAGNQITGNRTLRSLDDISGLPQKVISQLVSQWNPPEWIELKASLLQDGKTEITGGLWRLHVTYDGDDHTVYSIQTPYSKPQKLTRDDRRKAP